MLSEIYKTLKAHQGEEIKTPQKIIELIRRDAFINTSDMAYIIGIDRSNIARNIRKLQEQGIIRRIGPDKGGHWEIVNKH